MNKLSQAEKELAETIRKLRLSDEAGLKMQRERDSAQRREAVLRNRLTELLEIHWMINDETNHQTKATQSALEFRG